MKLVDASEWDDFLARHPGHHLLQTGPWGELKGKFGWRPLRLVGDSCGAQLLLRRLPFGLSLAYLPKGPVGAANHEFWLGLKKIARKQKAIAIQVEADGWEGEPACAAIPAAYRTEPHPIQPRRTIIVDLRGGEDAILARMKQKTRYNIRLAQKKGVNIAVSEDISLFHQLMRETGVRDGFGVHSADYFRTAHALFSKHGQCELLLAWHENEPLAGLMVFSSGERAFYLYGASTDRERNRMPAYLLQWEAMRWAIARGCACYDLWGVPDEEEEQLESQFASRQEGLWGVYRFKRGFGGQLRRACAARTLALNPLLYRAINLIRGFRND